jgi:hypothetical protein
LGKKHLNATDIKKTELDFFFYLLGRDSGGNSGDE